MKTPVWLLLPLLLSACLPRQSVGPSALNCTGVRSGTLTQVAFRLALNLDRQTNEVAGLLSEAGDKTFWVYGHRVPGNGSQSFILSVTDHTEAYLNIDAIIKKARLGYFTNSQSTLSGVLTGPAFSGRQKAGLNNYEVKMTCQPS